MKLPIQPSEINFRDKIDRLCTLELYLKCSGLLVKILETYLIVLHLYNVGQLKKFVNDFRDIEIN
jgi:hypothetical protein